MTKQKLIEEIIRLRKQIMDREIKLTKEHYNKEALLQLTKEELEEFLFHEQSELADM